ncbi:MAG: CotH kinase family protein [bacterium]
MRVISGRTLALALALCAIVGSASLSAGCGSTDPAALGGATDRGADEAYAGRYDGRFPDDRVQTVRVLMEAADWESLQKNALAEEYYQADIWIDDELLQDVAIRAKGNSSLRQVASAGSNRVGLKVDFNFFNSARSYHGIKKLNYSNGFKDPTLMKEFLSYELMAEMGIPTPRACFVDLWVNDTHLGVYTQVEQVDANFLAENFAESNGNLYKPEIMAGTLDWTEKDVATAGGMTASTSTTESFNIGGGDLEEIISRLGDVGWIPGRIGTTEEGQTTPTAGGFIGGPGFMGGSDYLTSVGLKTNENSPDYSRLFELLEVLNSEPSETSTRDLEQILEVDEILRFLAVSVVLVHLDNYIGMGHNYYLYEDGGKFWIIPWDLNESLGGFDSGLSRDQILNFFIDEPTAAAVAEYPLVEQLLSEPEYLETYHGYLRELVEGPFSPERMTARINEIAALIRPYVQADDNLFFSLDAFEQGLTEDVSSNVGSIRTMGGSFIGLTTFVAERTASISAQLSGERVAGKGDGSGNGGRKGIGMGLPGMGGPINGAPGQPPAGLPEGAPTAPPAAGLPGAG